MLACLLSADICANATVLPLNYTYTSARSVAITNMLKVVQVPISHAFLQMLEISAKVPVPFQSCLLISACFFVSTVQLIHACCCVKTLQLSYWKVAGALTKAGIKFTPAVACVFCWVDLRSALSEPTWEAERKLWEDGFVQRCGFIITPGILPQSCMQFSSRNTNASQEVAWR